MRGKSQAKNKLGTSGESMEPMKRLTALFLVFLGISAAFAQTTATQTKDNETTASDGKESLPTIHIRADSFYLIPNGRNAATLELGNPENALWSAIDPDKPCEYRVYLEQYPEGKFQALAKFRLKACRIDASDSTQAAGTKMRPPGEAFKDCEECPEMVVIPPGDFRMGSDHGDDDEKPIHTVLIARPFALAKTEVTQAQWRAIMGSNPSQFTNCGDSCPVEKISWEDAQEYVRRLSAKTGKTYRLPSEAEWEYACRAGGTQAYCGGDNLDQIAWYTENSKGTPHPVGGKRPNAFGLHDMTGNVWEWVEDCYGTSYDGAPADGGPWTPRECRRGLRRGGSWDSEPRISRASNRYWDEPSDRFSFYGFRPARTLP